MVILSAIFGFLAPFLPEVLKYLNRRQDHKYELEQLRVRTELEMKSQDAMHRARMAEIDAQADQAEAVALRQPEPSYGVAILDALAKHPAVPLWLTSACIFAYSMLDLAVRLVRPSVTTALVAFYIACKWAQFTMLRTVAGASVDSALLQTWTPFDESVLMLVLAYWFGQRTARQVFGWEKSA